MSYWFVVQNISGRKELANLLEKSQKEKLGMEQDLLVASTRSGDVKEALALIGKSNIIEEGEYIMEKIDEINQKY